MAHTSSPDHNLNLENSGILPTHSITRVTRSSARLAADTNPDPSPVTSTRVSASNHKRKAPDQHTSTSLHVSPGAEAAPHSSTRRTKRPKINENPNTVTPVVRSTRRRGGITEPEMSNIASSSKPTDDRNPNVDASAGAPVGKRRPGRNKKPLQEATISTQTPGRRQKKQLSKKDSDHVSKDADNEETKPIKKERASPTRLDHSDSNDAESPRDLEDDMSDPFGAGLFGTGRGPPLGMSSTLRALSGMMSGMSSRLRELLNNLRQKDDPTVQLVALEELSNLLLVSNEDNLSGQFSPDPYVKELISLMQPNEITGEENPETMLLACRCIANLMEALRGSVANVVYGGAVPVLCQKLLEIHYIDVAEQALSTLSKISIDFPGSIVREGGLTACLQFLDFFATGTQRTAVTTAANCCRNIPHDSFPVIRDVMPILQNVLVSPDQKVVEQGCLCVTRIIDSFKHNHEKLEDLVDAPLLKLVLGLLLPGTTNLIGVNIHTEFLRVLAIIARASPRLSMELLKMNVVDTLYQILTGVSPPDDTTNAASKIDSVVIMQALIHRPREQVYETLNVICELLPRPKGRSFSFDDYNDFVGDVTGDNTRARSKDSTNDKRVKLLETCKSDARRFAMVLLPTLTDAYSSTVNLNVRQKVLTAELKMLSNLDTEVIKEALLPVPYASFLASILSQEDHPSLVLLALQASELLLERLEDIYQYQFYREGVIGEIKKLAERPLAANKECLFSKHLHSTESLKAKRTYSNQSDAEQADAHPRDPLDGTEPQDDDYDEEQDDGADHGGDDEEYEEGEGDVVIREDGEGMSDSHSSDSSDQESLSEYAVPGIKDFIVLHAQKFLESYETSKGYELRDKASLILTELKSLAKDIEICYLGDGNGDGYQLFTRLAKFFQGDALDSITSSELLNSEIIRVLLEVFKDTSATGQPRADFLTAFMGISFPNKIPSGAGKGQKTAFSVLIQKLQDLLSRAEHFEVLTVNNSASENSRGSSTSMLSKQLRLKLTADADSDIPPSYRDITVSIHAIATFKALDDYLRPRISLSERPHSGQRRRDMLATLANARMRELSAASESRLFGTTSGLTASVSTAPSSDPKPKISRLPSKSMLPSAEKAESSSTAKESKAAPRRSSRRHQSGVSVSDAQPPVTVPEIDSENIHHRLECADEKQLPDDDGGAGVTEALEAIVDGLDEDTSDEETHEPSAVNMEIASTGKVTARKEDGTRVATPLQPGTPVPAGTQPDPARHPASIQSIRGSSLALSGRHFSYAAALAAVPQDWHIEFTMDDARIPKDTTIYRALYHNRKQPQDPSARNIWSGIHAIKFKRVKGPSTEPTKSKSVMDTPENEQCGSMPPSLDGHPMTSSILSLLGILHEMNSTVDDAFDDRRLSHKLASEPLAQFINTKLTAKMNRQLEEPLIVASNCLPSWSEDLARLFPFLFPFETRHLFLQSTSFGYSRSMIRWQSTQLESDDRRDRRRDERPLMGRLQRQKVRISRTRILESALKVMEMYGGSPSVLEVEYFEEVGTGLGPTLEFYSTVSKEFSKKKLKMWRENESNDQDEYAFGKLGLFPAPVNPEYFESDAGKKLLHLFKMLGNFVARSMLDSRIIDISFNSTFFRLAKDNLTVPSIALVKTVDHDLANSLAQVKHFAVAKTRIEQEPHMSPAQKTRALQEVCVQGVRVDDLMLDFTLPGYPSIELIPNGSSTPVTIDNVGLYIDRVLDMSIGAGVSRQIEAFKTGFSQVFSYSSLRAFTPDELIMLFGRVEEDWSLETLMDSIKADHGFNMDSKSVKNLLQTMSELTPTQRREFLQFVTGSPKLPIGGFKSLTPMFTVVCKPSEPPYTSDDYLPSVMTCVNYLKLPDYTDLKVLRERLNVAIREGQGAFHLS